MPGFRLHLILMLPTDLIFKHKAEKLILVNFSPLLLALILISIKGTLSLELEFFLAIFLALSRLPHIIWYLSSLSSLRQLASGKRSDIWIKVLVSIELLLLFSLLLLKPVQFLGWLCLIQFCHLILAWISIRNIFKNLPQQTIFIKLLMLFVWFNPLLGPWTLKKVLAPIVYSN